MAEVHIIGQIESAQDFPDNRLCCRWSLQIGGGWRVVEGDTEGQTQTDLPITENAYFCHPIDIHLATKSIQGWPKIHLEVWHHDVYGRQEIYGYGTAFIPTSPGEHVVCKKVYSAGTRQKKLDKHSSVITCNCWRPKGGFKDELMQFFVGGGLQLRSPAPLEDPVERQKLHTVAMGTVTLRLSIITRHFDRFGIQC